MGLAATACCLHCALAMHTCFPDITSSLFRMHRHSTRQPKWATWKLQDDFSMRYQSQLIVLQILHVEANTPLQIRLSVCKLISHMQLPERTLPDKDNMLHYNKVWGQVMASASNHKPCLKLNFRAGNSMIRLLATCMTNNFMPSYGYTFDAKCT